MIKDNHPTELKLAAYVENSLKPAEKRRVEAHLSTCDECRRQTEMAKEIANDFDKGLIASVPAQAKKKALDLMMDNIKKPQDVFSAVIQIGRHGLKLVQTHMEQVLEPLYPSAPAFSLARLETAPAFREENIIDGICADIADVDMDSSFIDDTSVFTNTLTLKEAVGKYDFEITIVPSSEKTFFLIIKLRDVYTGNPAHGVDVILQKNDRIIAAHKTSNDGAVYMDKLGIELDPGIYVIEVDNIQMKVNIAPVEQV